MKLTRQARTLVVLAVAAITVPGCSNAPQTGSVPETSAVGQSTQSPGTQTTTPLTAYLDSLYGLDRSPEDQQQKDAALNAQMEESVATCMKDAGFDYTPAPPPEALKGRGLRGPTDQDLDSKEWVAKYGYGTIETPEGKASDILAERLKKKTEGATNPNHAYVQSLTASEKTAYMKALYGESFNSEVKLSLADDWQKMGCSGAATHNVNPMQDPLESAEGKAVNTAIQDFENGWATWPGMPQLQAAWAACMSGKGYSGYKRQGDASSEISSKVEAARQHAGTGKTPANLPALADEERKLALTDLDCRVQTDFRSTYQSIETAAETKFMNDNAPALDALKEAAEQAGHK